MKLDDIYKILLPLIVILVGFFYSNYNYFVNFVNGPLFIGLRKMFIAPCRAAAPTLGIANLHHKQKRVAIPQASLHYK
jgi:Na+/H+-dicarboxylate symporter